MAYPSLHDKFQEYYLDERTRTTSNEKAFENACERFEKIHDIIVPFAFDSFRARQYRIKKARISSGPR